VPRRTEKLPTGFGERLLKALGHAHLSQNALEALVLINEHGQQMRGYSSRLIYGDRGTSIKPEWIFRMADALGVRERWLFIDEGPMIEPGKQPKTNREKGAAMARLAGISEEIIEKVLLELSGPAYDTFSAIAWFEEMNHASERRRALQAADKHARDEEKTLRERIEKGTDAAARAMSRRRKKLEAQKRRSEREAEQEHKKAIPSAKPGRRSMA
jgi:hypothetical protein